MTDTLPDYRDTVFLPKTDFPMKAGLPAKEPGILARWQEMGLYDRLREARSGRDKFILHDGPPYANGDMHIGHALNHILKDMVCRTRNLMGYDAPYVPGWDCHGLPIEWKVEEEYRKKKENKDEVPPDEFRAECRAYAQNWVDTQREQLKRLGIMGDWDHPYLTMDPQAEGTIVAELLKFAESGQLYRGAKPVMWSPVEKTALAEAEVEYEDIVSTQIDVAFEIVEAPNAPELQALIDKGEKVYAVIWTTTPWTIPVNQALAYGPEVEYRIYRRSAVALGFDGDDQFKLDQTARSVVEDGANSDTAAYFNEMDAKLTAGMAATGLDRLPEKVLVAVQLFETLNTRVAQRASTYDWSKDGLSQVEVDYIDNGTGPTIKGSDLAGTICRHPMHALGGFFAKPRPFLPGDFVTTDQGTGLVHMAPDHGEDDFALCKAYGIGPVFAVEADGRYRADWAWLGGQGSVINKAFVAADGPICADLRTAGALLAASDDFRHSYPHSWRSKAKVIYRCTPQWFVPMDQPAISVRPGDDRSGLIGEQSEPWASPHTASPLTQPSPQGGEGDKDTLRNRALAAIAATKFYPDKGRNRIGAMVEGRPDWVLSRQRAWGVPITLFVDRKTGQYLNDPAVNARIIAAVRAQGVDAWSEERAQEYLGSAYRAEDYERVTDILDVWFDSGSTHAFVLESGRWPDLRWPADLYLEGSDQHRGWFQSSLLESCGTRGRAPYEAVLTHGFTMDAKGMKMSKSLGNTINPLDLMKEYGADILRLWALSVDFTEDHRIGKEILAGVADQYRKLRNTFRYLLGALEGFDEAERLPVADMPELERYMLHRLAALDGELKAAARDYEFNRYVRLLADFANEDLSAFYFDIRKDSLYCDAPTSVKRRACRTVFDMLFHALVRYAAPVLVFTAEEVWGTRYPDGGSVHLLEWPTLPLTRHPGEGRGLASSSDGAEVSGTPGQIRGYELLAKWSRIRRVRSIVNEAIEPRRRDRDIGSSLEASVTILVGQSDFNIVSSLGVEELAEVLIVTSLDVRLDGLLDSMGLAETVVIDVTIHHKCGRCWRHLPEVTVDGALCGRCTEVVGE